MGIHEYKVSLERLKRRKRDLEKRIKEGKAYVVRILRSEGGHRRAMARGMRARTHARTLPRHLWLTFIPNRPSRSLRNPSTTTSVRLRKSTKRSWTRSPRFTARPRRSTRKASSSSFGISPTIPCSSDGTTTSRRCPSNPRDCNAGEGGLQRREGNCARGEGSRIEERMHIRRHVCVRCAE